MGSQAPGRAVETAARPEADGPARVKCQRAVRDARGRSVPEPAQRSRQEAVRGTVEKAIDTDSEYMQVSSCLEWERARTSHGGTVARGRGLDRRGRPNR